MDFNVIFTSMMNNWERYFSLPLPSNPHYTILPFRRSGPHSAICVAISDGEMPLYVVKIPRFKHSSIANNSIKNEYNALTFLKESHPQYSANFPLLYNYFKIKEVSVLTTHFIGGMMLNEMLDKTQDEKEIDLILSAGIDWLISFHRATRGGELSFAMENVLHKCDELDNLVKTLIPIDNFSIKEYNTNS